MDDRTCAVQTCDKLAKARGWCDAHYFRWRTSGDVQADKPLRRSPNPGAPCLVEGCPRKSCTHGMCQPHRDRATGKTNPATRVRNRAADRTCSVAGCEARVHARDYCAGHHTRWLASGDARPDVPLRPLKPVVGGCSEPGCDKASFARGLCPTDYHRKHRIARPDVYQAANCRRSNRKRAVAHGGKSAPVNRFEIFERDGWVCGVCGDAIDPTLVRPDMRSVSLDHIVPLARGGDHVPENCQAAHLGCNISKGCRVGPQPPGEAGRRGAKAS